MSETLALMLDSGDLIKLKTARLDIVSSRAGMHYRSIDHTNMSWP
jgi:hypothetical protein